MTRKKMQTNAELTGGTHASANEFLTDEQLATLLKIDQRTTLRWRTSGDGPPFARIGARRVLYRRGDVDAWLAARTFPHRAAEYMAA